MITLKRFCIPKCFKDEIIDSDAEDLQNLAVSLDLVDSAAPNAAPAAHNAAPAALMDAAMALQ